MESNGWFPVASFGKPTPWSDPKQGENGIIEASRDQPLARTHDGKYFMLIDLEQKEQTFIGIADGEIVESEFPPWPSLDPESKSLRAVDQIQ